MFSRFGICARTNCKLHRPNHFSFHANFPTNQKTKRANGKSGDLCKSGINPIATRVMSDQFCIERIVISMHKLLYFVSRKNKIDICVCNDVVNKKRTKKTNKKLNFLSIESTRKKSFFSTIPQFEYKVNESLSLYCLPTFYSIRSIKFIVFFLFPFFYWP